VGELVTDSRLPRFLWVDWQLREICKLMRESDILTRLGRLPKGLTGVYDEIIMTMKSHPDCNFDLAICALKWMLVAKRPLTPGELVTAVELNPPIHVDITSPPQGPTLAVELLIQSCEGLLLLDTTLGVVRFSHLSVQEYLETPNKIWDIRVVDAQLFAAESCLWLLQSCLKSPLYDYAARNWFQHCRSYQDLVLSALNTNDTKHELCIPLLDSFLGSFEEVSASYVEWADWVAAKNQAGDDQVDGDQDDDDHSLSLTLSTPLCPAFSAAFAGLGELVSWLWQSDGNDMNIENDSGYSLLSIASWHGTAWIVAEMLERPLDSNQVRMALRHASEAGQLGIITLLLDHGADVNWAIDSTPLMAAVREANLDTVTLLLDRGADVNLTDRIEGTALGQAARKGSLECVTLLLDRKADVNITGGYFGSALIAAAFGGNVSIVTLLLDREADDRFTGGAYGSALGAAAYHGALEIVTLFLDRGADVNITVDQYGTALGAAAYRGHLNIVTLRLDRGADVNIQGGLYCTALGAAAANKNLAVVTLLLARGADSKLTGGHHYGSVLGAAASGGVLEIVTLFLDGGADINHTGGYFGTALGAAARRGQLDIVSLLLGRGADVHLTGGEYGTALGAAAGSGNLEIIELLLDSGMDANSTAGGSGTALYIAAYCGEQDTARLLLDRGADVNALCGDFGTALCAAAGDGKLEVVRLLLDRGADPELADSEGRRPYDLAELEGHYNIADLFD